ncbi:MAG: GLUG motif-containing protein [Planctomycetota bacterium]|jgi:hypothetical protein
MMEVRKSGFLRTIPLVIAVCFLSFPAYAQYSGGTGEPNDPYLIYTAEQMNTIGAESNDWNKHFKLMADIDLSAFTGRAFNIIGYFVNWNDNKPFTGIFNGNGHTISNFIYTSTDTNYIGLFGYVGAWGKEALIKDLGLIDPNVDAGTGDYVGSLVGELRNGTITGCYVEGGNVSGDENVGGLVGAYGDEVMLGYPEPPFTISNCCSTSSVKGTSRVGGLVGANYVGRITNSYTTGNVSGNQSVGGLAGQNGKWGEYINFPPIPGTIINCYSTGLVSGQSNVGGLVGLNIEGPVIACLWDIETSGQSTSDGGMGKTTAEMQMESTFIEAGWDFMDETAKGTEDIWWILEGQDYPRLWWERDDLFFLVVDDFESYNDLDPDDPYSNRIFLTWIDGYDNPEINGSIVGNYDMYDLPNPTTIIHSGLQSMWYSYDNAVGISEATANVDNLVIGRDWTIEDVEVLSLWFRGNSPNAPETMYVVLNGVAGVDNDDPNATHVDKWTEWRIDLQEFVNQGVNLSNVNSITLGFGNRNNPVAGGKGEMWFDDIRLYRPVPQEPLPEPETDETTILGTWTWDVEADTLGRSETVDFWWEHVNETERYLVPINGAQAAVVSERSFDEVDLEFVNSLILSGQGLSGSDVGSVLNPGAVIAFQTSEGNKGKLRIEGYRALHDFSFPEASYLDEGLKSYLLTRPNREKYHLHVKWCLFQ